MKLRLAIAALGVLALAAIIAKPHLVAPRKILVSVKYENLKFLVTNIGQEPLYDVALTVNGDYAAAVGNLAKYEYRVLNAYTLTRDNGERFDPVRVAPKEAEVVSEEGRWSGTFR